MRKVNKKKRKNNFEEKKSFEFLKKKEKKEKDVKELDETLEEENNIKKAKLKKIKLFKKKNDAEDKVEEKKKKKKFVLFKKKKKDSSLKMENNIIKQKLDNSFNDNDFEDINNEGYDSINENDVTSIENNEFEEVNITDDENEFSNIEEEIKPKKKFKWFKMKKNKKDNKNNKNTKKISKTNNISNKSKKNKGRNNSKNKVKRPKRKLWKKLLTALLILAICGVLMVAGFFGYIVLTAPEFNEAAFDVKDQTVVYDINGDIIAKLGVQNRESVTYDQLPQVLIDAIIATEDSRYFQHNGVDLPRFIKAAFFQVLGRSDAGGASTLTMQMVKNSLTSTEDQGIAGIIRKFQDVYLAVFKVEKNYTKKEIIELYVNNHCLGSSIYGVGEASKYYFGKSVSELTLPEAALLAGLFQAPNRHNPYKNLESATSRRNTVLNLMVRHGYITKEEADYAKSIAIDTLLVGVQEEIDYQGFIDYVVTEVIELTGQDPAVVPMKVYTTMEKSIQDGVNAVMKNSTASYWRDEVVQAGIAIVNVETGAVAALSGQRNNSGERLFSYATEALRQPGSTAKPIFAYGPAIEYNNSSSYNIYVDEPWNYTNGPSVGNWDGQFHGIVTTRYALQYSRNVPALKAYQAVGSKKVAQFAYGLGLDVAYSTSSENYRIVDERTGLDNTVNEAYSIGGVSEGFSPLMMASAYSAFASGGYYTKPYSVTKIEYRDTGEVIEYKPSKTRVMKDSTAYIMNNILESAVNNGFNGGARVYGSHVAAKTGTSNFPDSVLQANKLPAGAVNDLWTVAYTSDYSVAVWYGYDNVDSKHYNVEGAWKNNLMSAVMKYVPKDPTGWSMPSSVVASRVEKQTYPAKLPSEYTPEDMILTEYFVRGTQPTEVSDRFVKLNEIENSTVTTSGTTATINWEYTTPTALTDDYLTSYFGQSIFGKEPEKLIEERKKYNQEKLGDIVFGIYTQNEDGTLNLIDYAYENSYTYSGSSGIVNLIIRAEHSNYSTNASDGVKVSFILTSDGTASSLSVGLNGNPSIEVAVGQYSEPGIGSITYGNEDVSGSANLTVSYQIIVDGMSTSYNSVSKLEEAINKLAAGTYKINYVISYKDHRTIKNRTVTLK